VADTRQLDRALRLLSILNTGYWYTVKELHERLGPDENVRSVYRDLKWLERSELRLPLERERRAHNEMRIRLKEKFHASAPLTPDEALVALLLSPFAAHLMGSQMGTVLEGMLEKVDQLMPRKGLFAQTDLLELRNWVMFSRSNQLAFPHKPPMVMQLLESIVARRVLQVDYIKQGSGKLHQHTVHPHALVQHQGALYLLVWHPVHENWLHFAVHRTMAVKLEAEEFTRQPDFQLSRFVNGSFGIWYEEPVEVRLSFDSVVASHLHERTWHPSQRWEKGPENRLNMCMTVGLSPELRAWILRWGQHVRVEEPIELRNEIVQEMESTLSQYKLNSL